MGGGGEEHEEDELPHCDTQQRRKKTFLMTIFWTDRATEAVAIFVNVEDIACGCV